MAELLGGPALAMYDEIFARYARFICPPPPLLSLYLPRHHIYNAWKFLVGQAHPSSCQTFKFCTMLLPVIVALQCVLVVPGRFKEISSSIYGIDFTSYVLYMAILNARHMPKPDYEHS